MIYVSDDACKARRHPQGVSSVSFGSLVVCCEKQLISLDTIFAIAVKNNDITLLEIGHYIESSWNPLVNSRMHTIRMGHKLLSLKPVLSL